MNSTVSRGRNLKHEKRNIKKKELVSSKFKNEEVEDNSNAVNGFRRYNLRSHSMSKDTSKMEKSKNRDSEYVTNENEKKVIRNDKIINPVSLKQVHPTKKDKTGLCLPSEMSCKVQRNTLTKRQISKYKPTTEAENINENPVEADFHLANTFPPYKSILKRVDTINSPVKYPLVPNISEKDTIKERIYGFPALRQKKVTFKTMSCQNLETICYGNIPPKEMTETTETYVEENVSALIGIGVSERICESTTKDNTCNLFVHKLNENANNCKISLENDAEEIKNSLFKKTQSSNERQNYCQKIKNKPETLGDNFPILGLFCQNTIDSPNASNTPQTENKNEYQGDIIKRLSTTENNKTELKIEDFRILKKVRTPDASQIFINLQKRRFDESFELRHMECGDHGNKLDFVNESVHSIEERNSNSGVSANSEDTNENSICDTLAFSTTQRSPSHEQKDQKQMIRNGILKNGNEDKLKLVTLKFLQEMNKRENFKNKSPSINLNKSVEKTKYDEIDDIQATFKKKNEPSIKPTVEQNVVLSRSLKPSNLEVCKTPQKVSSPQKKQIFDSNQSDFKSPSKIPRLKCLQHRESPFSPLFKAENTPTKSKITEDEITQMQSSSNYYLVSDDEIDKRKDVNESILTCASSVLSKGKNMDSSIAEDSDMIDESLKILDQYENLRNEGFPGIHDDFVSCISDDECNLINSATDFENETNESREFTNGEETEVLQRINISTREKYGTSEGKRSEKNQKNNERNCSLKMHDNKKEQTEQTRSPALKEKKNRINGRAFLISFFMSLFLYLFILKMFDIPSCNI